MIRVKSAFNVMKSNFVGDARKCKMGQDAKDIEKYCVSNFDSFDEIESCKDPNNFCHSCCDNEFGAIK
jgi:hypothetical protein